MLRSFAGRSLADRPATARDVRGGTWERWPGKRGRVHGASGWASATLPPFLDGGLALAESASSVLRPSRTSSTVGIVANPASGRDIRRLVSQASVFPTTEKSNMVQRMLGARARAGRDRAAAPEAPPHRDLDSGPARRDCARGRLRLEPAPCRRPGLVAARHHLRAGSDVRGAGRHRPLLGRWPAASRRTAGAPRTFAPPRAPALGAGSHDGRRAPRPGTDRRGRRGGPGNAGAP